MAWHREIHLEHKSIYNKHFSS